MSRKKRSKFRDKVHAIAARFVREHRYSSWEEALQHARAIVGASKARKSERAAASKRAHKLHSEAFGHR